MSVINEIWALSCEIAFWAWVLSIAGFLYFSFPSRGVFVRKTAVTWGGVFLISYTVWGFTMVCF